MPVATEMTPRAGHASAVILNGAPFPFTTRTSVATAARLGSEGRYWTNRDVRSGAYVGPAGRGRSSLRTTTKPNSTTASRVAGKNASRYTVRLTPPRDENTANVDEPANERDESTEIIITSDSVNMPTDKRQASVTTATRPASRIADCGGGEPVVCRVLSVCQYATCALNVVQTCVEDHGHALWRRAQLDVDDVQLEVL